MARKPDTKPGSKRRARRIGATSWDKISAREAGETLTNRDVYEGQQLDRGAIQPRRSKSSCITAGVVAGVTTTILTWLLFSVLASAISNLTSISEENQRVQVGVPAYYVSEIHSGPGGQPETCYRPLEKNGRPSLTDCYSDLKKVPVPGWYTKAKREYEKTRARAAEEGKGHTAAQDTPSGPVSVGEALTDVTLNKLLVCGGTGLLIGLVLGTWLIKQVDAENLRRDTSDINQYANDQHIALPEEIQRKFDWFPDAGAHSSVQASSMISHMMLRNKGLKSVEMLVRADRDMLDDDGDVEYFKGEALEDEDGNQITQTLPIIDEAFGEDLFDASGLPGSKDLRKRYDTRVVPYNPDGADRDKLPGYDSVADMINGDWDMPDYEVQRPAGAYIVDTAPVNTMVLAITRAGKGQTYIEPMLDMWMREKNPSNTVVNDPKGELLVKNYIPAVVRGFEVVQFNLINVMKTDIYNPLAMAAQAARAGDATKCAMYVENIADVFFPLDGSEDPVWPNAANNAFKRTAYGLIDFYLEEERELRTEAASTGMDAETLEARLDEMWGKVTLYNCYQLFVQLTSKKIKNPAKELEARIKAGEFDDDLDALELEEARIARKAFMWEDRPEQDMLTLFFNASEALPTNTMRTLVGNANNALRSMAGAEKMLASVYGIAITAMSFFADPTIATLTSGRPTQNVDLASLSFPRRLGVRFSGNYLKRDHLIGLQAKWSAYDDAMFTESLGSDFDHEDTVSREGWARYFFKGKFPRDEAWVKLELINPETHMLVRTFHFAFKKSYQTSLNGRHFVTEPVTGRKIIKNGVLRELRAVYDDQRRIIGYEPGDTTYPSTRLETHPNGQLEKVKAPARAITQTQVGYTESPKMVFLVTPPHLMSYAKLILILVKQLVDLNFDQSYMTKSTQKPLYRTRYMLDELGNLQSAGKGIAGFETMLSIGLGQEQQFTLILQTLQQLRDVYGESVDKIVQGNTSNIVFLKSTDDSMIETLEKMSGTTHRSYIDSKSISRDVERLGLQADGKVSYTMTTKEEPLISYNDMAFIPERNSIVFRAGDAPVWNRNETILPMSWRLLKDKIVHPGHDYSLQTIPTLSSAKDFDVRTNQPDFMKMLDRRMAQAERAAEAKELYKQAHNYSDFDVSRLDPDIYSEEVMDLIESMVAGASGRVRGGSAGSAGSGPRVLDPDDETYRMMMFDDDDVVDNDDVSNAVAERSAAAAVLDELVYAEGTICRGMLINADGSAKFPTGYGWLDREIAEAFKAVRTDLMHDRANFSFGPDGELRSADGSTTYISAPPSDALRKLNDAARQGRAAVYAEAEVETGQLSAVATAQINEEFYRFLAGLPTWKHLAGGEFDRAMAVEMRNK